LFNAKNIFTFLILTKTSFANADDIWTNEVMPDTEWCEKLPPKFIWCFNKSKTDIRVYKQAIKYWKDKGYLKGVSSKISIENCENDPDDLGKIRLAGEEGIDEGHYGVTTRQLIKVERVSGEVGTYVGSAYIRIEREHSNNLKLIIHELGHAIGLNHKKEKTSIMYRYFMNEETKL